MSTTMALLRSEKEPSAGRSRGATAVTSPPPVTSPRASSVCSLFPNRSRLSGPLSCLAPRGAALLPAPHSLSCTFVPSAASCSQLLSLPRDRAPGPSVLLRKEDRAARSSASAELLRALCLDAPAPCLCDITRRFVPFPAWAVPCLRLPSPPGTAPEPRHPRCLVSNLPLSGATLTVLPVTGKSFRDFF